MDELVAWLREQIAEKRRRAMRTQWTAGGPPAAWTYNREGFRLTSLDPAGNAQGVAHRRAGTGTDGEPYDDVLLDVDGEHMEFNDPQAAVAECDAHTSLIDFWSLAYSKPSDFSGPQWDQVRANAKWTVKKIASAYRHRPGYREEWRP